MRFKLHQPHGNQRQAFTLAEVVIAIAIVATTFAGAIVAYTQTARRAQWSGYSLAAQALAIQQVEQARSAQWQANGVNDITNLLLIGRSVSGNVVTGYSTNILDIPYSGTNYVMATNRVTLRPLIVGSAQVPIYLVKVDTIWPFTWGSSTRYYTNTVLTYCAPDNRDNSSM
ncbi:MAG: type II secretion system protein [Akkermansiaceae bacterium]|nr:type II secretion system protein [Verrucomicrobiales bacterium]